MNLQEALAPIGPVVGLTSMIAAPQSVGGSPQSLPSLAEARDKLSSLTQNRDNANSDAAYWGYAGQVSYWEAVVDILEAAEIVGLDDLPDVDPPEQNGVVMTIMARIEAYGQEILAQAKAREGIS